MIKMFSRILSLSFWYLRYHKPPLVPGSVLEQTRAPNTVRLLIFNSGIRHLDVLIVRWVCWNRAVDNYRSNAPQCGLNGDNSSLIYIHRTWTPCHCNAAPGHCTESGNVQGLPNSIPTARHRVYRVHLDRHQSTNIKSQTSSGWWKPAGLKSRRTSQLYHVCLFNTSLLATSLSTSWFMPCYNMIYLIYMPSRILLIVPQIHPQLK